MQTRQLRKQRHASRIQKVTISYYYNRLQWYTPMLILEVTIAREVLPCKQLLFYSQKNHIAQLNEFILFENIEITTGYYKYYLL